MGSFGENLRREREMRGVTLEEISAATKISVRFLKSIENEEFSKLPGGIFNRSFVRAYARYLGLDEDPLVEEFQQAAKTKAETDLTQFSPPKTYSRPKRHSRGIVLGVVVAVALLGISYALWQHTRKPAGTSVATARQALVSKASKDGRAATSSQVRTAQGSSTAAPAVTSSNNQANDGSHKAANTSAKQGVLAATSAMSPTVPKLPPVGNTNGRLVLQVATTERSWVAIDADGKMISQGIMHPDEVKTYTAKNSFYVLTGNAQGVILSLNGKTLHRLGGKGEVKQIRLNWESLKSLNSH